MLSPPIRPRRRRQRRSGRRPRRRRRRRQRRVRRPPRSHRRASEGDDVLVLGALGHRPSTAPRRTGRTGSHRGRAGPLVRVRQTDLSGRFGGHERWSGPTNAAEDPICGTERAENARRCGPRVTAARYIAVEGGEATGKTTQAARLAASLDAVLTREPGGTRLGARLREIVLDPANTELADRTEALLYAADRAQHAAEVVEPALAAGRHV